MISLNMSPGPIRTVGLPCRRLCLSLYELQRYCACYGVTQVMRETLWRNCNLLKVTAGLERLEIRCLGLGITKAPILLHRTPESDSLQP